MADVKRGRPFLSSLLSSFSQDDIDPVGRNLTQCYAHAVKVDHHFGEAIFGDKIEQFVDGKLNNESSARDAISDAITQAQDRLKNLRKHSDKKIQQFAKSKAAQYVANMKFPGLAPSRR
jgi:hypothetical protein